MSVSKVGTVILSLLAFLSLSIAWGDQIVLKNGDRLTGSIVKKEGNSLTIKTDQFGVVTTSWGRWRQYRPTRR